MWTTTNGGSDATCLLQETQGGLPIVEVLKHYQRVSSPCLKMHISTLRILAFKKYWASICTISCYIFMLHIQKHEATMLLTDPLYYSNRPPVPKHPHSRRGPRSNRMASDQRGPDQRGVDVLLPYGDVRPNGSGDRRSGDRRGAQRLSGMSGTNCIKIGLPGKLILSVIKGLCEVLFSW